MVSFTVKYELSENANGEQILLEHSYMGNRLIATYNKGDIKDLVLANKKLEDIMDKLETSKIRVSGLLGLANERTEEEINKSLDHLKEMCRRIKDGER